MFGLTAKEGIEIFWGIVCALILLEIIMRKIDTRR
mgnify:CR=1 FL=1